MADLKNLVEEIKKLTVVEVADLVKMLEEEFGVSAAAVAVGAAPAAAAAVEEEPTSVTVHMTAVDAAQKIPTIKAVREITGLGLGEAKAIVDGAPKAVKENISKEECDKNLQNLMNLMAIDIAFEYEQYEDFLYDFPLFSKCDGIEELFYTIKANGI